MKLTGLFGVIALSCLTGSARAQALGRVTININNPLWVINTNFNTTNASQVAAIPGSGADILNLGAAVATGNTALIVNHAQSNVQGVRNGAIPLGGAVSATNGVPGGNMSFIFNGPSNGIAVVNGTVTPTGVLPNHQAVNMTGNSSMTLNCGQFGVGGPKEARTASASVVPPGCGGKICSVYCRLILSAVASINMSFSVPAFFYSQQGTASASCTLTVGSSASHTTETLTDFTANLN